MANYLYNGANPVTAYLLNLFDLVFILYATEAYELNPLMQCIPFQIFYKVIVVEAMLWVLHRLRAFRLARFGLMIATAVFTAVDLWHIVNIAAIASIIN